MNKASLKWKLTRKEPWEETHWPHCSSYLLPGISTGHTQLKVTEACDGAHHTNQSLRAEISISKSESWSVVSNERYSAQPTCFACHWSFSSFIQLKTTCSHRRRHDEFPSAVVLSWSDNSFIILSPVFQGHHWVWLLCWVCPSAGAAKNGDLAINQIHAFTFIIN